MVIASLAQTAGGAPGPRRRIEDFSAGQVVPAIPARGYEDAAVQQPGGGVRSAGCEQVADRIHCPWGIGAEETGRAATRSGTQKSSAADNRRGLENSAMAFLLPVCRCDGHVRGFIPCRPSSVPVWHIALLWR